MSWTSYLADFPYGGKPSGYVHGPMKVLKDVLAFPVMFQLFTPFFARRSTCPPVEDRERSFEVAS